MNELFFHECRAAGLVFKTSDDWFKWLTDNGYDIKKPVAEHEGFKYTIKDFCINPHVIEYSVEGADNWGWKVTTATTFTLATPTSGSTPWSWWNCTRNWDTSSCNRQKKQNKSNKQ